MEDTDVLGGGISVVLIAYDQGEVIYGVASGLAEGLEREGTDHELIVIDDGSTDGTRAEMARLAADYPTIKTIEIQETRGKGYSMFKGFRASSKETVCFADCVDGLKLAHLADPIRQMRSLDADILMGSKVHPDSRRLYPLQRRLLMAIYYYIVRLLLGIRVRDTQSLIRVFRRDTLVRSVPRVTFKTSVTNLEFLVVARLLDLKVAERPLSIDVKGMSRRIRWSEARTIMVNTAAVIYRFHVLRYYSSTLLPPSGREPSVSIVIPTRGMDPMVEECLRKCDELDYGNREVLLIPDAPLGDEVQRPGVRVMQSGPVGPSIKRNMGIESSSSEVIAFIDADAWPEEEWLRNAAPYFEEEDVAAVCGPGITATIAEPRLSQASGLVYLSTLVSGRTTYRYTYHAMRDVDDYPSCNLLIRREELEKACSFPVEFWPGEDTVLCLRITSELGKRIVYVPNVVVFHHRRSLFIPHMRQVYAYASHRGFFVRKFPETSRRFQYFVPSLFVIGLIVGLIGSFLHPAILYAYLSVIGFYLFLVLMSSIKTIDIIINSLVFVGIILTNLTYGVGFLKGLFSRSMEI